MGAERPRERSVIERIALLPALGRHELLNGLSDEELRELLECWCLWARPGQLPPAGDWRIWLMMAGRGYGKTRAGAEWVHHLAEEPGLRIALIGPSDDEVRAVMVEGASGLIASARADALPAWEPSQGVLTWPSGSKAFVYSGAHPDGLRGPEHDFAWCDEVAKWARAQTSWDNMMFGLRRGHRPRVMATTTPRPGPLLHDLMKTDRIVVTRGSTADNGHLSPDFLAHVTGLYGGTRLGRQELDGELIEEVDGALWSRALIERCRIAETSDLVRVVVAVDPPASSEGDACGIIAAGIDGAGRAIVIEDASVEKATPERWALAVADCAARWSAERVIAEANNGGQMVASVLAAADSGLPVRLVHASRGKSARAEPVMMLYERGKAFHAKAFAALEDQMCGMMTGGGYEGPGRSPDRADALVWAMTELMLGKRVAARVRMI